MFFINGRFLSQRITGVQRYAAEISLRLKGLRRDGQIVAPRQVVHDELSAQLEAKAVGRGGGYFWEQIELPLMLGRAGNPLLLNLGNLAPLGYRNSIVVIYDLGFLRFPQNYSRRFLLFYRNIVPIIARRCRHIITVSEFSKQELGTLLKLEADKISVIPGAVAEAFSDDVRNDPGPVEGGYALAVSSLAPNKNLSRLIAAFSAVPLKGRRLIIAGGRGRTFADPRLEEALQANPNISFSGPADDSRLAALYRGARLLVFPSLYEGFGLPPLEAMACGCPVVVSRVASLPEVCGRAALYCDPYNVADIADKINVLWTDATLRQELSERGREQAKIFNWQESARKLSRILDKFT